MRERRSKIAHMLANGACMIDGVNYALYGESVGRYREITDYLEMRYEDLRGNNEDRI